MQTVKCMEARRLITPFIRKELGEKEQEEFLKHVEHCADCKDELDIYFTVHRALDSLDSGSRSFDFQNMLEEEMRAAKRGILKKKAMRIGRILGIVVVELLLLLSVFTGYELRNGTESTLHRTFYAGKSGRLTEEEITDKVMTEKKNAEEIGGNHAGKREDRTDRRA